MRARRPPVALRAALAALLVAGAGCPLPQPLTDIAGQGKTTLTTPPLIVTSSVTPADSVILVATGCTAPHFALDLQVEDLDVTEQVEARWFVDYAPPYDVGIQRTDLIPGPEDPTAVTRTIPTFDYQPDPAASLHVVEVVVSNGFAPSGNSGPLPNRSPADGYQTQIFRWVFQLVDPTNPAARCSYP